MNRIFSIAILVFFLFLKHYACLSQTNVNKQKSIDSLEALLEKSKTKAKIYNELSAHYASISTEKSIEYAKLSLKAAILENNKAQQSEAYCLIGNSYYELSSFDKALQEYKKALKIDIELNNDTNIATDYNFIGTAYEAINEYDTALEYYHKSLKINKKIDNKKVLAHNYSNIAMIYSNWGQYDDAIEYNLLSIEIDSISNDLNSLAIDYNNIGLCYCYKKVFDKSINYFNLAVELSKQTGNEKNTGNFLNNIGLVYYQTGDYEKAIYYFNKAIEISEKYGNKRDAIIFTINMASIYGFKLGDYEIAFKYLDTCEKVSLENAYTKSLADAYGTKFKLFKKQNNYEKALEYNILYQATLDSIFTKNSKETLEKYRAEYETEKKEQQIVILEQDQELKNIKIKKRNLVIYAVSLGFIALLVLGIMVLRAYRQKKKAYELINEQKNEILEKNEELNQQNEEIAAQRDEIIIQRNLLEEKNKQITASIEYAKRIQSAILPTEEWITKSLPEHFILFMPKDIVSGDFYWAASHDDNFIITAVDCTGHGVPGAFMSMLGIAFLNEIVNKNRSLKANEILNQLRDYTIKALHQTGKDGEAVDGMDMSLCIVNKNKMSLQFSGANNPIWIIRDNEINETKADKAPIGIYRDGLVPFTNHIIDIKTDDIIYLFSDGYADQFGGPNNRKIGKNNFQKLLLDIKSMPLDKQKDFLRSYFKKWQSSNKQIDDVLVIGVKI